MRLRSLKDVLIFFLNNFPKAALTNEFTLSAVVSNQTVKICEKADGKDLFFWHTEARISKPNEAAGLQMVNYKVANQTQRLCENLRTHGMLWIR